MISPRRVRKYLKRRKKKKVKNRLERYPRIGKFDKRYPVLSNVSRFDDRENFSSFPSDDTTVRFLFVLTEIFLARAIRFTLDYRLERKGIENTRESDLPRGLRIEISSKDYGTRSRRGSATDIVWYLLGSRCSILESYEEPRNFDNFNDGRTIVYRKASQTAIRETRARALSLSFGSTVFLLYRSKESSSHRGKRVRA